jgi:sugar phosphate isomerase/epimerase
VSVPHEWWPSTPLLKSYEAAGFAWVQLHAPPISVLTDPRACRRHAGALGAALSQTSLRAVLHAPGGMRLGHSPHRAFDGLLSYAAEVGVEQVVYHALAFPDEAGNGDAAETEARGLALLARAAERLALRVAIENLAPVYPGPETISASPLSVRSLARRVDSPALRMCLDVGHAHVIADAHHTWVESICEPVLDTVGLFHIHDNLGARRTRTGKELGVDPLRLDLHLPPGRGTLPWERLAPLLAGHTAPLVVEVHPPFRPRAAELCRRTHELLRRGRLG